MLRNNDGVPAQREGKRITAGIHVRASLIRHLDSAPLGIDRPEFLGAGAFAIKYSCQGEPPAYRGAFEMAR